MLHGRGPGEALLSGSQSPDCRGQAAWVASRTELSHHQSNNQQAKALSLKSKTSTTLPPHTKSTPHGGDVGGAGVSLATFSHPLASMGKGWVFLQNSRGGRAQWMWSPVNLMKVGAKHSFWPGHPTPVFRPRRVKT